MVCHLLRLALGKLWATFGPVSIAINYMAGSSFSRANERFSSWLPVQPTRKGAPSLNKQTDPPREELTGQKVLLGQRAQT